MIKQFIIWHRLVTHYAQPNDNNKVNTLLNKIIEEIVNEKIEEIKNRRN